MEPILKEKTEKVSMQASKFSPIRVTKSTYKKFQTVLEKINKKDFGKRVKADQLILEMLATIPNEMIERLRQNSLSNQDRLEMKFKEFAAKNSGVSKDEFIGRLLEGKEQI